jgi:hypothetical protein
MSAEPDRARAERIAQSIVANHQAKVYFGNPGMIRDPREQFAAKRALTT